MSGIEYLDEHLKEIMSAPRATIMASFYANNVEEIKNLSQMYKLTKKSKGVVELKGRKIYKPRKLGLPLGANQLLFNDGATVGRCAAARRIVGNENCNLTEILPIIREAIYNSRFKKMYKAQTLVGLDEDFMIKANLLTPENFEPIVYSWLLNFQVLNKEYQKRYKKSKKMNVGDIFIFSDPQWSHPDYPYGLAFFDPEHNCAAILGMKYFGEFKKATLTLAWNTASRNGYVSCHGGMKRYNLKKTFQAAFFGLSGSGKSTLTHAKHNDKYDITVLHDDAFIIDSKNHNSIALEPAYFDKTQDYPVGCEDNKYILMQQNNGVIQDKNGKLYAVTEDIRNGNGRAIKSRFWSKNRVDRIDEKISAVFWLMKDSTIPPILKITNPALSSAMGATLATKRSSAEKLAKNIDRSALVIEPYANPFRVYPLNIDYKRFKELFESGVDCYILNTGNFMGKDIPAKLTLSIIEDIVEGTAQFRKWGSFSDIMTMHNEGYIADFSSYDYKEEFKAAWQKRMDFVDSRKFQNAGIDELPPDAILALSKVFEEV